MLMQLETSQDASQGWTLQQALERTADPNAWALWLKAKADFDKIKMPIPSSPGAFIVSSSVKVEESRQAALAAYNSLIVQFREHLILGSLAAVGSRHGGSIQPTPLFREGWRTLKLLNLTRSIVRETGSTKTKIYNVRVYPLIHSEDAPAQLSGQSIAKVFFKAVLADPEVVAASKRIPDYSRHKGVFEQGQFPGPVIDFKWTLNFTPAELAYEFVRQIIWFADTPTPVASPQIKAVAAIVSDRWNRLKSRLIAGELVGTGTYVATGQLAQIAPLQWVREDARLDVQNSDLIHMEGHKPVIRWSSILLTKAAAGIPPVPEPIDAPASSSSSKRRRPVADSVAKALKKHGLQDSPANHSMKDIAALIGADMPRPPKIASDTEALAKAIKRHYDNIGRKPV